MAIRDVVQAAAGAEPATYIEDVFSTYLYDGTGSTQTITNGIDLAGKGGLVWIKNRGGVFNNILFDSTRTGQYLLISNSTAAQRNEGGVVWNRLINGFSISNDGASNEYNNTSQLYTSWTFRKQPKFFDIVTWSGNGVAGRQIAHGLSSTPGTIIIKATGGTNNWIVWHRSINGGTGNGYLILNSTNAELTTQTAAGVWGRFGDGTQYISPTSSSFTVGANGDVNGSGNTYVAYLFAHDAGGFGASGSDNVISCGSFTGAATVSLGYEPQWVLMKTTSGTGNWMLVDNMRGLPASGNPQELQPNTTAAETSNGSININSTGFVSNLSTGVTYIYIAIRRPMKTPTVGTQVYNAIARTGTGAATTLTGVGFTPDLLIDCNRDASATEPFKYWWDRLRGTRFLASSNTNAEAGGSDDLAGFDAMDGVRFGQSLSLRTNGSSYPYINWFFRRAPGFFDVVCYTGTGANRTVSHNLGVAPELIIVKVRGYIGSWYAYVSHLGATKYMQINSANAVSTSSAWWNDTDPTSTVFTVGTQGAVNGTADTYVAYLFASCPGVSKVGSYTGNGSSQTVNCGFTSGARFILIKRTDGGGDWIVWDTARGINPGNDPYLALNTTVAENTSNDFIDQDNSGFIVNGAGINNTGETYIYLAIA